MIMRLRKPDRRRFKSRIQERRRRQREYYYASISILVVKIVLFVFLVILFVVSFKLFHFRFQNTVPPLRYAVPVIIAIFTILLGYFIFKNFKELIELSKDRR